MTQAVLYVFDRHLDDTRKWRQGVFTCGTCGRSFMVVHRVDRQPSCPKCVITDRVTEVKA